MVAGDCVGTPRHERRAKHAWIRMEEKRLLRIEKEKMIALLHTPRLVINNDRKETDRGESEKAVSKTRAYLEANIKHIAFAMQP